MPAAAIAVASEACEEGLEFRAVRGRTRAALPVYAASGRLHPAPDRFTRSRHVVDPSLAVFREGKTQPLNLPAGALQRRGHFVLECAIRQQLLAEKINPRGALLLLLAPVFERRGMTWTTRTLWTVRVWLPPMMQHASSPVGRKGR
jgi:hypothetical protein